MTISTKKTPLLCRTLLPAALLLAAAADEALAAGYLAAVPAEPTERIACAKGDGSAYLTWKRALGLNRNRSLAGAALYVSRRIDSLEAKADELSKLPPTPEITARLAKLAAKLDKLAALADSIEDCGSGALFEAEDGPPSFRFLCRFGFQAPSVASRRECSINLARVLREISQDTDPAEWSIDAVAGIVDELLAGACAETGGILLRNVNLSSAAPMYSAVCAHENQRVATHYGSNALVLGMEEEPTGPCIIARFTSAQADDDCGDYKRPPRGGGGGSPPPPPDEDDCVIVRMEEEPTGCE